MCNMRNIMKLLISIMLVFTLSLSACGKQDNQQSTSDNKQSTNEEVFSSTSYCLADKGNSNYKIVLPNDASDYETFAASELQLFIEKSTSCKLDIIKDNQVSQNECLISVGNTAFLSNESSIVVDEAKLKDAGLLIKTVDSIVYLVGATGVGTVNAVYEFLRLHIGFKAYAVDCVVYNHCPTINLLNINYEYTPSVQFIVSNEQENNFKEELIPNNMRMHITMNVSGSGGFNLDGKLYTMFTHTNDYIISYTDAHKDWFNSKGNQLCYSNEEMIEEFCKRFYNSFVVGKSEQFCMLGVNDFPGSCNCSKCQENVDKYGGQGGIYVRFMNRVAEYVEEQLTLEGSDRKLTLVGLMYYDYDKPPVKVNADGSYEAYDKSVIPDSEGQVTVGVCFTPIDACYTHPFNDQSCEANKTYYEKYKQWSFLTKELSTYIYATNSASYMMPFNNWSSYGENFRMFDELGVRYVYDEACSANGLTSMQSLRIFIRSSLAWDASQDVEDLIQEFFSVYYGVGSQYVNEYFDSLMGQFEYIYVKTNNQHHAYNYGKHDNTNCWPLQTLLNFENILQSGMNAINSNKYLSANEKDVYSERIFREFCLNKIQQQRLYRTDFAGDEREELDEFVEYACKKYNIVQASNEVH